MIFILICQLFFVSLQYQNKTTMAKCKYIITKNEDIIVFGNAQNHVDYQCMAPIRAGFINFIMNDEGDVDVVCCGKSESLKLESDEKRDTYLARIELGFTGF